MILQLNPSLPVTTPKGKALAHFIIDDGVEHDLKWVVFLDQNGECWTFQNRDIRAQLNETQCRTYISPYYDPDEAKLPPGFRDHAQVIIRGENNNAEEKSITRKGIQTLIGNCKSCGPIEYDIFRDFYLGKIICPKCKEMLF